MLNALRRWLDAWRHPGEYPRQRVRRRRLEGFARAEADRQQLEEDRPRLADILEGRR